MDQKKIVSIVFIALVLLTLFMFFDNAQKKGLNGKSVSPNILYITQPVTSFSGIVEKIEGNVVSISSRYTLPQTASIVITVMPNQPPIMPTPKTVTVMYKVVISGKTQIVQPPFFIPYLFKAVPAATEPKLSIKDIRVGSSITITSQVDLRTLEGILFEATMINLPQQINILNGKIVRINADILTMKAFPPPTMDAFANPAAMDQPQNAPKEKEYTITLTSDTEISRYGYDTTIALGGAPSAPKTEKLTLSELKKDMQITVYTDADVTEGIKFNALRIEPMMTAAAPVASTSALPTP